MEKSKDLTAVEAIKKIKSFDKVGEMRNFAKSDSRKTVTDAVDAAAVKIKSQRKTKTVKSEKKTTPQR